jgi:hypothetical protein
MVCHWQTINERSNVGVGIGPPNVLLTPKPTSSVRMSRMLGAPLGVLTSCGKSFVGSLSVRPMWPLNGVLGLGKTSCPLARGEMIAIIAKQPRKQGRYRSGAGVSKLGSSLPYQKSQIFLQVSRFSPRCSLESVLRLSQNVQNISLHTITDGGRWNCQK